MNPGLSVRGLDVEGVTGRGITVAIIDPPVMLDLLFDSAYVTDHNMKVINPRAFIDRVRLTVKE
jgi:hypothetical protein